MKNITKVFATSAAVLMFMIATPAFASSSINQGQYDHGYLGYTTLGVVNISDYPNSTNFTSSAPADAGETVAFSIYYHNSGTEALQNLRVQINPASTGVGTSHTFTATVSADNAASVTGSATVTLSSSQSLSFDPNYVSVCRDHGKNDCIQIPGSAITSGGLTLGSIAPDSTCSSSQGSFCHQGTVVVHYKVSNNNPPPPPPPPPPQATLPIVTTQPATNIATASATLNGYVTTNNSNQTITNCWFEWGQYSLSSTQNASCSIFTSGNFQAYVTGLTPNTNYTFRACAQNSAGTSCGATLPFTTLGSSYVPPPIYQANVSAVTLAPTAITQTSATLNGIASQTGGSSMTAWFEWGSTTSFGNVTSSQSLGAVYSTNYFTSITGLSSNVYYYYRAVVQSASGQIAYGGIQTFRTLSTASAPAQVVIVSGTGSGSTLVQLDIKNLFGNSCVGSSIEYNVHFKNISGRSLSDAVLTGALPQDVSFLDSTRGEYSISDRTVVVKLGTLDVGEEDTFIIRATIKTSTLERDQMVATATLAFTHPVSRAQESAIAYDLSTATRSCGSVLGAFAFFDFFPHTLAGWLLIILILLAIYFIARRLYTSRRVMTSTTTSMNSNNVPPGLPRY